MVVEVSLRTPSTTNDESGEWMVEKRSGFAGHRLTLHFHIIPVRLKISYLSFEFISKAVTKYMSIVWVLKEWGNFHSNFGKMIHSILIPARTSLVISGWIEENPKEITGSIIISRCWYVRTTVRRDDEYSNVQSRKQETLKTMKCCFFECICVMWWLVMA